MSKKPNSKKDSIKDWPLWMWGCLCIFGGAMAGALNSTSRPVTAEDRAAAIGGALATLMFVGGGVVLIILHFVRRRRRP
jgi:hypothetical protein